MPAGSKLLQLTIYYNYALFVSVAPPRLETDKMAIAVPVIGKMTLFAPTAPMEENKSE